MKFFILPTLILAAFILAVAPAIAQTSNVTATVRPNPMEVEVSAPSLGGIGKWFSIEVTITNKGAQSITKTFAKIHTSSDLKLKTRGKKKRIGTLAPGKTVEAVWLAKAKSSGQYIIQVDVEGFLEDEKITASDTAEMEVTGSILSFWIRLLFGL